MKSRGFTLIEAIIYIALFSILIGGGVVAAFYLFENAAKGGASVMLDEELSFMLSKIAWSVRTGDAIASPVSGAESGTLTITDGGGASLVFSQHGDDLTLRAGVGAPAPLNNTNVKIENVRFIHAKAIDGERLESLQAVLTVSARTDNGMTLTRIATDTVYVER